MKGGISTLVFISDLHLNDGSGGRQSLDGRAFSGTLDELKTVAEQAEAREVELIFLGDVVDMVRTTLWLWQDRSATGPETDVRERPWGSKAALEAGSPLPPEVQKRALYILNQIKANNRSTFELLSSPLRDKYFPTCDHEPTRVFIPGNHDRICDQDPELRQLVIKMLGIDLNPTTPQGDTVGVQRNPNQPFDHDYRNSAYRTFARHGHEWDSLNIELPAGRSVTTPGGLAPADYLAVPIGDVIACEVASKIGPLVSQGLSIPGILDPAEVTQVEAIFGAIDDVRPLVAVIPYLLTAMRQVAQRFPHSRVFDAVQDAVSRAAREFADLEFVQAWTDRHWTWNPLDQAHLLAYALALGMERTLGRLWTFLELSRPVQGFIDRLRGDNLASPAMRDLAALNRVGPDYLYLLYGHTHCPQQVALSEDAAHRARVYLNTGTWRRHVSQGLSGTGYMAWHGLTYTVIYHGREKPQKTLRQPAGFPTFETWTGSLVDRAKL